MKNLIAMNRLRNLCIVACLALPAFASAQNNQFNEVIPRTPNAGSLGKYGDIPVSHHTGVPNISIPIYTIKEGPLSLPISLSYHSSGIKVDEVASWVGLGWSLNAGGMISRTVIGGPDEGGAGSGSGSTERVGWGWYKNGGIPPELLDPSLCDSHYANPNQGVIWNDNPYPYPCKNYSMEAATGVSDTEPDLFTFNFPEGSGKFIFDKNGKAHTIPWEDFHIEPINENLSDQDPANDKYFVGWKIIAPNGTRYYFGGLSATEKSYTFVNGSGNYTPLYNKTTSWFLNKIESANGKHYIEFEYEPELYSYSNRSGHSISIVPINNSINGLPNLASTILSKQAVTGVRLSKITTSSGTVTLDFNESTNQREDLDDPPGGGNKDTKALANISISSPSGYCKIFTLNTDYFESEPDNSSSPTIGYGNNSSDQKRLKLISVQETSCNSIAVIPPYIFTYNETVSMARRYSLAMDYWGYYNGQIYNAGLIPDHIQRSGATDINGGSLRDPNSTKMKAWILEKIDYPTGGNVQFDYEVHKYSNNTKIAGGLRIKTITKEFQSSAPVVTNYQYEDAALYTKDPYSSVTAFFKTSTSSNQSLSYFLAVGGNNTLGFEDLVIGTPRSPVYSTQGYHIGYGIVKELRADGSYTQYNYDHNVIPYHGTFPEVPASNPFGKGELKKSSQIDVGENEIAYTAYQLDFNYGQGAEITVEAMKGAAIMAYQYDAQNNLVPELEYAAFQSYEITAKRERLLSKIDFQDGLTLTTTYGYDATNKHNNPTTITVTDSHGKTIVTENTYPSDAGSGAPNAMFDPANTYYRNMLGVVVDSKQKVNGTILAQTHNNYTFNSTENLLQLTSSRTYPTGSSDYVDSYFTYNYQDNISVVQKENDLKTSYLWGYGGAYPIAQVQNADSKDVFHTSFEDGQGNSSDGDSKTGRKSKTDGFSTVLGNLTSGTYILSYWQKTGGNWVPVTQEVQVTGVYTISLYDQVDEVRLCPASSQITTYTYDPGFGISSVTDPNNITTYYEYDDLGRLKALKDHEGNVLKMYAYKYKN